MEWPDWEFYEFVNLDVVEMIEDALAIAYDLGDLSRTKCIDIFDQWVYIFLAEKGGDEWKETQKKYTEFRNLFKMERNQEWQGQSTMIYNKESMMKKRPAVIDALRLKDKSFEDLAKRISVVMNKILMQYSPAMPLYQQKYFLDQMIRILTRGYQVDEYDKFIEAIENKSVWEGGLKVWDRGHVCETINQCQ